MCDEIRNGSSADMHLVVSRVAMTMASYVLGGIGTQEGSGKRSE